MKILGLFKRTKPQRPRVQAYAAIAAAEVNARLLGAPESPMYQALLVVVDEEIVRLADAAREEGLEERVIRHRLGGMDALQGLKDTLEERIEEARRQEQAKEKGDNREDAEAQR